ncbi:hypothetical protein DLAC_08903 [Tieghemostelium lacteum]|uniref:F-box domain-containing protein n=1 Tax=Tieghemostelium lacteum TaxID=361077 RepID=A0A151Z8L2_TIELA|nr:hypothetical protein DLAC_08903 [Tieghemostelium lacteum]|eukprot:KYQ90300.1 hypothetical protein DLAC_08903 [Tieghemostelium lacteum]
MLIPNYIIIEILNHLVGNVDIYYNKQINYQFIAKLRSISKEWNEKILPKVQFVNINLKITQDNKNQLEYVNKLLELDISGFTLKLPSDLVDDQLMERFAKSKSKPILTFELEYNCMEKWEKIRNISFFHNIDKFILNYKIDDKLPLYSGTNFNGLKQIELHNMNVTLNEIMEFLEITQPMYFQLHSTPYEFIKSTMDPFYDYIATKNKTMLHLGVYNFFWPASQKAVINLINQNKSLTELYVANIEDPETPSGELIVGPHCDIFNNTLKLFSYYDYIQFWRIPSKIRHTEVKIQQKNLVDTLNNYFGNLTSLHLYSADKLTENILVSIIKLKSSIHTLKVDSENDLLNVYSDKFVDALACNNTLTLLKIGWILNNLIAKIIKMNHPTITSLTCTVENGYFLSVVHNDLIQNQTLNSLTFNVLRFTTKERKSKERINFALSILEKNTNITKFHYPSILLRYKLSKDIISRLTNIFNNNNKLLQLSLFEFKEQSVVSLLKNNYIVQN